MPQIFYYKPLYTVNIGRWVQTWIQTEAIDDSANTGRTRLDPFKTNNVKVAKKCADRIWDSCDLVEEEMLNRKKRGEEVTPQIQ